MDYHPVENCMLSSVVSISKELLNILKNINGYMIMTESTPLPIVNLYKTPKTLGPDRLSNAVAGAFLFPKKNVLIVDTGTCIKYDFINKNREYCGGSISPGLAMRYRALHEFTGKLP